MNQDCVLQPLTKVSKQYNIGKNMMYRLAREYPSCFVRVKNKIYVKVDKFHSLIMNSENI